MTDQMAGHVDSNPLLEMVPHNAALQTGGVMPLSLRRGRFKALQVGCGEHYASFIAPKSYMLTDSFGSQQ